MLELITNLQLRLLELTDRKSDRGATAVEYGLMVALIAGVIIAAVTLLGGNVRDVFNTVAGKITIAA
jgi:pilus assembly protein Flp/PilA